MGRARIPAAHRGGGRCRGRVRGQGPGQLLQVWASGHSWEQVLVLVEHSGSDRPWRGKASNGKPGGVAGARGDRKAGLLWQLWAGRVLTLRRDGCHGTPCCPGRPRGARVLPSVLVLLCVACAAPISPPGLLPTLTAHRRVSCRRPPPTPRATPCPPTHTHPPLLAPPPLTARGAHRSPIRNRGSWPSSPLSSGTPVPSSHVGHRHRPSALPAPPPSPARATAPWSAGRTVPGDIPRPSSISQAPQSASLFFSWLTDVVLVCHDRVWRRAGLW